MYPLYQMGVCSRISRPQVWCTEKIAHSTFANWFKKYRQEVYKSIEEDHLPVEEIILEPKEDTTGMKCIGREISDLLELIPTNRAVQA
jgi:hypothetical protein